MTLLLAQQETCPVSGEDYLTMEYIPRQSLPAVSTTRSVVLSLVCIVDGILRNTDQGNRNPHIPTEPTCQELDNAKIPMARVAPAKESPVVMGIYLITLVPLESVSILMMENGSPYT